MEQLIKIIDTLYEILTALSQLNLTECEELVPDFKTRFNDWATILLNLDRLVKGCTPWGLPIEWGAQPWQQPMYRKQAGLTLHAGWEDIFEPGIDLKPIELVEEPIYLRTPIVVTLPPSGAKEEKKITDTCRLGYIPSALRIAFDEVVEVTNLDSDSSEDLLELPFTLFPVERESTPDSLPDLEDEVSPMPTVVRRTLRGCRRRYNFPRSPPAPSNQPWREVLGDMLNEQEFLNIRESSV